jgi:hypothetical protein
MSCIPHLLKLKGDNDIFKINPNVILETGGNYKGYDYCVVFNYRGFRCGYVAVSANHPILKGYKDDYDLPIRVHGGVTFCEKPNGLVEEQLLREDSCGDVWIGFDANHAWDLHDFEHALKLFPDREDEIKRIKSWDILFSHDSYFRSNDYIEDECKSMIDQIINNEPPKE